VLLSAKVPTGHSFKHNLVTFSAYVLFALEQFTTHCLIGTSPNIEGEVGQTVTQFPVELSENCTPVQELTPTHLLDRLSAYVMPMDKGKVGHVATHSLVALKPSA